MEAGQRLLPRGFCPARAAGIASHVPPAASGPVRAAKEACLLCLGHGCLSGTGPQRSVGLSPHGVVLEAGLSAWLHKSCSFFCWLLLGQQDAYYECPIDLYIDDRSMSRVSGGAGYWETPVPKSFWDRVIKII
ncbi:hypothetical protein NDU88_005790 [Pleurodeles waltl]|uniref:Uncharacterized protein n=1 Tax=Pleurodeles waltl TaxID=8319 RepID=A0AAV7QIW1_PLEWA|nr:hypothetical protein NDU88_005790 [Pleurodeles waltl]